VERFVGTGAGRREVDEGTMTTGGKDRDVVGSGFPSINDDEGSGCSVSAVEVAGTIDDGGRLAAAEGGGTVTYSVLVTKTTRTVVVGAEERSVERIAPLASVAWSEMAALGAGMLVEEIGCRKLKGGRVLVGWRKVVGLGTVLRIGRAWDVFGRALVTLVKAKVSPELRGTMLELVAIVALMAVDNVVVRGM